MKQINDESNVRAINDILKDFISVLDEAIATYNVLEKIKEEDSKPNQLLFCHIVNGFDSFIRSLLVNVISENNDILKDYFEKNTNIEEKISMKEFIIINEIGIYEWMKKQTEGKIEDDLRRKRHSQILEMLLEKIGLKANFYVCLMGTGLFASGCLKNSPTKKSKLSVNHKTTPENPIGYADLLYEKRNSITHNRNYYFPKVLARLNKDWNLQIERELVLIRRSTIKSLVRFYTSIILKATESKIISKHIHAELSDIQINLNKLREFEKIIITENEIDARSVGGGIKERQALLVSTFTKKFNLKDYILKMNPAISDSTARRDLKEFKKIGIIKESNPGIFETTRS